MKILAVDPARQCVGCRECELACSLKHEGTFAPWLSRVKVERKEDIVLASPVICRHCPDAPCAAACPVDAIPRSEATGAVYVDSRLCIGCLQCIEACPYDAMFFNNSKGIAMKCDMCGGEAECVKACPAYVIIEEVREDG